MFCRNPLPVRLWVLWGGGADRVRLSAVFVLVTTVIFAFTALPGFSEDYSEYIKPESEYDTVVKDVVNTSIIDSKVFIDGGIVTNRDYSGNFEILNTLYKNNSLEINVAENGYTYIQGGIIFNYQKIKTINADFYGNTIRINSTPDKTLSTVYAGQIWNQGSEIDTIEANFVNNKIIAENTYGKGGAIDNLKTINSLKGNFINNTFITSKGQVQGGAIRNEDTALIKSVNGNFIGNNVCSTDNYAIGGAIHNSGSIDNIEANFLNNSATTFSTNKIAIGGAIFNQSNLQFSANDKPIVFSGNYTLDSSGKVNNAIFTSTSTSTRIADNEGNTTGYTYTFHNRAVTLNALNNGKFIFDDTIDGGGQLIIYNHELQKFESYLAGSIVRGDYVDGDGNVQDTRYTLALTGDGSGEVLFNNDVFNAKIEHGDVVTTVSDVKYLNHSESDGRNSLSMNSGGLNIHNMGVESLNFKELALTGGEINLYGVKADLRSGVIGGISADTAVIGDTVINIRDLSLKSDSKQHLSSLKVAEAGTNVKYLGNLTLFAPIFKYSSSYDAISGNMNFIRGAGYSESGWRAFNPSILASSVALQGVYSNQLEAFSIAMSNSESYMMLPKSQRLALRTRNKFAANPDVGVFSPLYSYENGDAFWVKTYASFENIPLHNGPKVGNINYGTVIGHDSEIVRIKNGFERVITPYIAYTGNSQHFQGLSTTQNGGLLGGTVTLYKNNFFNATTLSAGATAGESSTMYGSENFTMLSAGIGNKTGYNFEFKNGRFILQPALLVSYTFINTFDYNNAAGVRIKSDPLNAIQVAPGIKFIANTKSGWQPYIAVNFVYNILDKTKVKADDVRLPEMSIKPYVEYGIGVQKIFKNDSFTAYAQAMLRSAGRSGVSLNAGLRWRVGKAK